MYLSIEQYTSEFARGRFEMPALLKRCAHLMSKYSDVPMDYADATLVAVGETLGIRDVLTLDRGGFSVYRYASRGAFRIFPD